VWGEGGAGRVKERINKRVNSGTRDFRIPYKRKRAKLAISEGKHFPLAVGGGGGRQRN